MIDEDLLADLQAAYISGEGLKALCQENNLDLNSVIKQAKLENWAKPKPKAVKPKSKTPHDDDLITRGHKYSERMADIIETTITHLETLEAEEVLQNVEGIRKLDEVARKAYGLDREQVGGPTLNVNILAMGIQAFAQIEPPKLLSNAPTTIELQTAN